MRRHWPLALVLLSAACAEVSAPDYVSADEIGGKAEASLIYPGVTYVSHAAIGEFDGDYSFFPAQEPHPAVAKTDFYTPDRVDRVIGWYDERLGARGWLDSTDQGDGDRRWERGEHEDFSVDCSHLSTSGDHHCYVAYSLRSSRFKAPAQAAPPFGDPVTIAAVRDRKVGMAAIQGSCCASPVLLDEVSMPADPAGTRTAYHAVTLQVAEYDRPYVEGGAFGSIERDELKNLEDAGFVLINVGTALLSGSHANVYALERGQREAVVFSIAYGGASAGGQGVRYRLATLRIVYDVTAASCDLSRNGCFDVLAGTAGVSWIHA